MQIQLQKGYAAIGMFLEGDIEKALLYKPFAIKKIKELFELAKGGTLTKSIDPEDGVKIFLKVQGNQGRIRVEAYFDVAGYMIESGTGEGVVTEYPSEIALTIDGKDVALYFHSPYFLDNTVASIAVGRIATLMGVAQQIIDYRVGGVAIVQSTYTVYDDVVIGETISTTEAKGASAKIRTGSILFNSLGYLFSTYGPSGVDVVKTTNSIRIDYVTVVGHEEFELVSVDTYSYGTIAYGDLSSAYGIAMEQLKFFLLASYVGRPLLGGVTKKLFNIGTGAAYFIACSDLDGIVTGELHIVSYIKSFKPQEGGYALYKQDISYVTMRNNFFNPPTTYEEWVAKTQGKKLLFRNTSEYYIAGIKYINHIDNIIFTKIDKSAYPLTHDIKRYTYNPTGRGKYSDLRAKQKAKYTISIGELTSVYCTDKSIWVITGAAPDNYRAHDLYYKGTQYATEIPTTIKKYDFNTGILKTTTNITDGSNLLRSSSADMLGGIADEEYLYWYGIGRVAKVSLATGIKIKDTGELDTLDVPRGVAFSVYEKNASMCFCGDFLLYSYMKTDAYTDYGFYSGYYHLYEWTPMYNVLVIDKNTLEIIAYAASKYIGGVIDAQQKGLTKGVAGKVKFISQTIDKKSSADYTNLHENANHFENNIEYDGRSGFIFKLGTQEVLGESLTANTNTIYTNALVALPLFTSQAYNHAEKKI